eukprot:TCONS_00016144-protein
MTTEELLNKLDQICKCGVCLERFHEPKQLVCQHIFCQQCLMQACVTNKMGLMTLFCPTCRERQPLVYRSFDVMKLKPSFFVNQILEVLVEFAVGNGKLLPHSLSTPQKLLNTKITSVYKSINTDTLEHMTQIRTDEFGVRDLKVQELEEQVQRSKEINSQLLIDNYIMKAKLGEPLDQSSDSNLKQASREVSIKKNISQDSESVSNTKCKQLQISDIEKTQGTSHIEAKLNRYLRKKALNNIQREVDDQKCDQEKSKITENENVIPIKKDTKPKGKKHIEKDKVETRKESNVEESPRDFCWRCLRRGHTGVECKENKTILGRYICSKCDKVGHNSNHCQLTAGHSIVD